MELVDILIVGAGASGAAVAWSLSNCELSIVCLEQGDYAKVNSYPSTRPDWELDKLEKFNPNPNVRKLDADYPINDAESPISIANYNGVGGSTVLFSGHFPRFHPSDFRVKTLDGLCEDWPINYADLEPYYRLNDSMIGVSGLEGDPAYPPISDLMPPVPLGKMGEKLGEGFNSLGWHWWPSYSAIITKRKGSREPCINLGPCNTGCAQGAKSSADVSYWPLAIKNGVELRTQCRVSKILVNEFGRVKGVIYFDENGDERIQRARIVILACNGVGTPRLLLNSASEIFADGLANRSGLVGRNLMLHPCGYVEGIFPEKLYSSLGPQGCCIFSQEFYETDLTRGFVRGYTMQALRGPGPLEYALSASVRRELPWGQNHHEYFASHYEHTAHIAIIAEDLPEPSNRVILDPALTDADGIPAPKIIYALSDNSKKILAHGMNKGRALMSAAGATRSSAFGPVRHTGWHLMGTTRMGNDPEKSVVNSYGQSHDVPNLFVVDSSVFVTSAAVNPTSTLQAIALRSASYIKENITYLLSLSDAPK